MSNPIILPPLPEPVYTYDEDGNKVFYEKASLVRARDIEVVRLVLEAAAKVADGFSPSERQSYIEYCPDAIRKMEVRHHE